MIATLNGALLEMQGALLARSLYPQEHPRIRSGEERAAALLTRTLETHAELTAFAIEDRVIVDGQMLPASASLCENLFRRLRRLGVDRITFRRGLESGEVRGFLDALAREEPIPDSPHLAFGHLDLADAPAVSRPTAPGLVPEDAASYQDVATALDETWNKIDGMARFDADALGDVITIISAALRGSTGAMLPLVPLKRHDEYTFVHTINVALLSTALAEALGFTGRDIHDLNLAALLHDVGKRIIPHELLNKNGRFTDEEFRLVQLHPVEGARMLLATPGVPELAPIVAYEHHVRADGSGYPKVPRRWRLSLASRIVQVADVFDALRTHRPYRPALPLEEIAEIMRKDAGVFFDADILDVFYQRVVAIGVPQAEDEPATAALEPHEADREPALVAADDPSGTATNPIRL